MDRCQVKVGTCYSDAIHRIDKIHQRNEDYALKSEVRHEKRMARNNNKEKNLISRSRLQSA